MYKDCATEESVRRQRQLEQCLQELMLVQSYEQITVGDICDRAGIARKSFYRYFSSKDGCLHALVDHAIFDGSSYYLPGIRDSRNYLMLFRRFLSYWKDHRDLLEALMRNDLSALLVQRLQHYTNAEQMEFRIFIQERTENTRETALFYVTGVLAVLFDWHSHGYQKSVDQMAAILSGLIL